MTTVARPRQALPARDCPMNRPPRRGRAPPRSGWRYDCTRPGILNDGTLQILAHQQMVPASQAGSIGKIGVATSTLQPRAGPAQSNMGKGGQPHWRGNGHHSFHFVSAVTWAWSKTRLVTMIAATARDVRPPDKWRGASRCLSPILIAAPWRVSPDVRPDHLHGAGNVSSQLRWRQQLVRGPGTNTVAKGKHWAAWITLGRVAITVDHRHREGYSRLWPRAYAGTDNGLMMRKGNTPFGWK